MTHDDLPWKLGTLVMTCPAPSTGAPESQVLHELSQHSSQQAERQNGHHNHDRPQPLSHSMGCSGLLYLLGWKYV
jgi:hypothetical protein